MRGKGRRHLVTPRHAVDEEKSLKKTLGLVLGPVLFLLILLLEPVGLDPSGQAALAVALWMVVWWITEAIPIPATSLLPLVLFPLTGAISIDEAAAPYASPVIFLFLGGFLIAVAMERWNLHRRVALSVMQTVGTRPERIIGGFMAATAILSAWISNTATTMMMVPIAFAVVDQAARMGKRDPELAGISFEPGEFNFGTALMIGIAYSATIGGVATLIGTPPNLILAGAMKSIYGIEISFARWLVFATPLSLIGLVIAWWFLTHLAYPARISEIPGGQRVISEEMGKLGPITREEKIVGGVFVLVAVMWITRGFLWGHLLPLVGDSTIAILGAVLLFVLPARRGQRILNWEAAAHIPWGVILLFGGGLSLAHAAEVTGLARWIGEHLGMLQGLPPLVMILGIVSVTILLTEVASNTAIAAIFMPIMAGLADAIGVHPFVTMIPAAVAASFAFMLPVATPPNAIVFGTHYITAPKLARAGLFMNIASALLLTGMLYVLLPLVWGVSLK